jgi:HTH-type transcriptional regulator/antitoxin HipB
MIDDFAKKLREARKSKGLTQGELGAKIGLPQSHISQIEAGNIDIRLSSLLEIARLLDLEPMLIPRPMIPAVRAITSNRSDVGKIPAWRATTDNEEPQ